MTKSEFKIRTQASYKRKLEKQNVESVKTRRVVVGKEELKSYK